MTHFFIANAPKFSIEEDDELREIAQSVILEGAWTESWRQALFDDWVTIARDDGWSVAIAEAFANQAMDRLADHVADVQLKMSVGGAA